MSCKSSVCISFETDEETTKASMNEGEFLGLTSFIVPSATFEKLSVDQ
jgi:hypothetical protein